MRRLVCDTVRTAKGGREVTLRSCFRLGNSTGHVMLVAKSQDPRRVARGTSFIDIANYDRDRTAVPRRGPKQRAPAAAFGRGDGDAAAVPAGWKEQKDDAGKEAGGLQGGGEEEEDVAQLEAALLRHYEVTCEHFYQSELLIFYAS